MLNDILELPIIKQKIEQFKTDLQAQIGFNIQVVVLPASLEPSYILDVIAKELNISTAIVLGKNRHREYVLARQLFTYIMRNHLVFGFTSIAKILKCDHSTIMHQNRTFANLLDSSDNPATLIYNKIISFLNLKPLV